MNSNVNKVIWRTLTTNSTIWNRSHHASCVSSFLFSISHTVPDEHSIAVFGGYGNHPSSGAVTRLGGIQLVSGDGEITYLYTL